MPRSTVLRACAGVLACASTIAIAQSFPTKPIRVLATASAGGVTDIMTRVMADEVARTIGQPVIVENRAGAGGNIAGAAVAKAPPDGYLLVVVNVGLPAMHRYIYKELAFDPIRDFTPIAPLGEVPSILTIYDKLPVRDLKEFIAYARSNPGKVNYASAGAGTMPHVAAEYFSQLTGVRMEHVPYKGGGPAAVDLATGQVQAGFLGIGSVRPQWVAGQVRMLAVAAPQRLDAAPDVPTFVQAGLAGYDATNWFGVLGPAGLPTDIVQTLNAHITRMYDNPAIVKRMQDAGILPMRESAAAFASRIIADDQKWRETIKRAGIAPQ